MGPMNQAFVATAARKSLRCSTQEGKFIRFSNDLMLNHRNMHRV